MVKKNEVKRSYFLNLFSGNAEKTVNSAGTKNIQFRWQIRDLQLGSVAEIGLVQLVHTNATNNTGYAIRILETFQDGWDAYNQTSAMLYLGLGLNTPSITTYHKLISQNLNTITLVLTDDLSSASTVYGGINTNITFAIVLEIIDYIDDNQNY
jgi:hypothetical protein